MKHKNLLIILLILVLFSFNIKDVKAAIDTDAICNANKKDGYDKMCIYESGDDNVVILYIKSNESLVRIFDYEGNPQYDIVNSFAVTENIGYCNPYYIKNNIGGLDECPVIIESTVTQVSDGAADGSCISEKGWYGPGSSLGSSDNDGMGNSYQITAHQFLEKYNPSTCEKEERVSIDIGEDKEITCADLIDADMRDLIDKILTYVRILIPILALALGMVDFATAVLGNKEEDMKKAQARFIKRIIIAIAIFLVPSIIKLLLDLANEAWKNGLFGNSNCGL